MSVKVELGCVKQPILMELIRLKSHYVIIILCKDFNKHVLFKVHIGSPLIIPVCLFQMI